LTIVYDFQEGMHNLVLYEMSLYTDPIVFDVLTQNEWIDMDDVTFIVNNTYAVIFLWSEVFDECWCRMLVYEIKNDLYLFCGIDLGELIPDFKGIVLSACWYDEHIVAFIAAYPLMLYTFDLTEKKLTFIAKIPEKEGKMSLFYISSTSKDYFCVLDDPDLCYLDNPEDVSIWLLEKSLDKSLDTVEKNKKTLSDYIGGGYTNFQFSCSWNVNTTNGKSFVMMTSKRYDYVNLFCFDLLYPETTLKILYEYCIPASSIRPTMIVNEQEDATEVLLLWNTQLEVDYESRLPNVSLDGFFIVKPSASLKFLCKMCIKKYYKVDEISSAELPKTLKQYLLS